MRFKGKVGKFIRQSMVPPHFADFIIDRLLTCAPPRLAPLAQGRKGVGVTTG